VKTESKGEPLTMDDRSLSAWDAAAMGIDMSIIEYSLTLTPDERMFQHDCALRTVLMLEEAARLIAIKQRQRVKSS
jgi:hypothetical protein